MNSALTLVKGLAGAWVGMMNPKLTLHIQGMEAYLVQASLLAN